MRPEPGRRQLRVVLVVAESTGGIGQHVRTLVEGLTRRGHAVVVCAPPATEQVFGFGPAGADVRPGPIGATLPWTVISGLRLLRASSTSADVVHAHGLRAAAFAAAAGASPLLATWHNAPSGSAGRRWVHTRLERWVAARTAVTLAASADLAARATAAGAREVRVEPVIAPSLPEGRRSERLRASLASDGRPLVLAVARLAAQKRVDLLVAATAGWVDDTAKPVVAVAGDGPLRRRLARQAARVGSSVRFLGHRTDVAELLACADAAVLSSDWEARPLFAQEALRAGVPLVITDVGGVASLVGDAALLVSADDPRALQEALLAVCSDPTLRRRLTDAGRRQTQSWPTVEDMIDGIETQYLKLSSTYSR